jgi:nicotinate phosphoribosyltransferase
MQSPPLFAGPPGSPRLRAASAKAPSSRPFNALVTPMLTDFYQITMVYAYWKGGRHEDPAVFEAFFRKNPFNGEFTIFAGLSEVLRLVESFRFTEQDMQYIRSKLVDAEDAFFDYLAAMDCSQLTICACPEGSVVFPRTPLVRVEGPLAVAQILETTILNLVNFPSLICTNAVRMRQAAGEDKVLLEFGLRRAQGPDGAMSASRYSYMGGFDGSSNVAAGMAFDIQLRGTHAHAFVSAYQGPESLSDFGLGTCENFWVRLSACLLVCLPACLPACLSACLPAPPHHHTHPAHPPARRWSWTSASS